MRMLVVFAVTIICSVSAVSWGLGVGFAESEPFSLSNHASTAIAKAAVSRDIRPEFTVANRPVGGAIKLSLKLPSPQELTVLLFTVSGRQVKSGKIQADAGRTTHQWSLLRKGNTMPATGMYLLNIRHTDGVSTHQVMIIEKGGDK